jgi:hypothetical protein
MPQQAIVERPVERDRQRPAGAARRHGHGPRTRGDVTALVGPDPVAPLRGGPEPAAGRVAQSVADDEPERLAGLQRVAGLAVRGQASLDPGRLKQDREPAAGGAPQLVLSARQSRRQLEVVQRETADVDRASNEDVTNENKSERRLSGGELFAEVLEMKWRRL